MVILFDSVQEEKVEYSDFVDLHCPFYLGVKLLAELQRSQQLFRLKLD